MSKETLEIKVCCGPNCSRQDRCDAVFDELTNGLEGIPNKSLEWSSCLGGCYYPPYIHLQYGSASKLVGRVNQPDGFTTTEICEILLEETAKLQKS